MSETLKILRDFILSHKGEIAPGVGLEEIYLIPQMLELSQNVEVFGSEPHSISEVPPAPLQYFQDGIQRTILVGNLYVGSLALTVHYSVVASGILYLTDQGFRIWDKVLVRESILVPFGLLGESLDPPFVDTGVTEVYYEKMRLQAAHISRRLRHNIEAKHLDQWYQSTGGSQWILCDGSLWHLDPTAPARKAAVGVAKEFHPMFFTADRQQKMMNLAPGYRSPVFTFSPPHCDGAPLASFFIRLHSPQGKDPLFGLVRVEFSPDSEPELTADRIASGIYLQRYPVTYPMLKWDRLLYSFRVCAEFLGAQTPNIKVIKAFFGRGVG
ncbi:MAG: hypothetical protein V2G42_05435 [bacterium JZ-2024 1]